MPPNEILSEKRSGPRDAAGLDQSDRSPRYSFWHRPASKMLVAGVEKQFRARLKRAVGRGARLDCVSRRGACK